MRRNYRTSEAWWSGAAGIEPPGGDDDTAKHFSTSSSRSAAQRAWLFVKSAMGMAMKADRHVAGVVAFNLVMEYVDIAFFWPEQGAAHSQQVMQIESGYLSTEFTRSLLLSQPTVTVTAWITQIYQWLVVDSGLQGWSALQNQAMENCGMRWQLD